MKDTRMAIQKGLVCAVFAAVLSLGLPDARASLRGGDQPAFGTSHAVAGSAALAAHHVPGEAEAVFAQSSRAPGHRHRQDQNAVQFEIPKAMQVEHEELHADLTRLTQAGGKTGNAAGAVAAVLHNHFTKENEYALPPLSLLVPLSQGRFDCGMTDVLKLTDKLEAEMPAMLAEHKEIVAALQKLGEAAKAEGKPEGVRFAERLAAHAEEEEQITYPTALLVGLYVKGKAGQCKP